MLVEFIEKFQNDRGNNIELIVFRGWRLFHLERSNDKTITRVRMNVIKDDYLFYIYK